MEGEVFAQIMFDLKNSQDHCLLAIFEPKYNELVELETKKADCLPGYVHCSPPSQYIEFFVDYGGSSLLCSRFTAAEIKVLQECCGRPNTTTASISFLGCD
jgi:hypothetical protein